MEPEEIDRTLWGELESESSDDVSFVIFFHKYNFVNGRKKVAVDAA